MATNPFDSRYTGSSLPEPARYFPPIRGIYDVGPGFSAFGTDLGNGAADRRVFQLDTDFPRYRAAKQASRKEDLEKYYRIDRFRVDQGRTIARFMIRHLTLDYPQWFRQTGDRDSTVLHCSLSGDRLRFDSDMVLVDCEPGPTETGPEYVSALDALACQIQEDVAVVSRDASGRHWLSAVHVCLPNYWSIRDKIGHEFAAIHEPVAGMDRVVQRGDAMVTAMIDKGPFVRFGWGLATDARLNHHPDPPPGLDATEWQGRRFDAVRPELYLRVERQITWGFPEVSAGLFLIRSYITDLRHAESSQRMQLANAVESMTEAQLRYKGLERDKASILHWLRR
jgi:hypothetical protein